jgi:hypothetical protein
VLREHLREQEALQQQQLDKLAAMDTDEDEAATAAAAANGIAGAAEVAGRPNQGMGDAAASGAAGGTAAAAAAKPVPVPVPDVLSDAEQERWVKTDNIIMGVLRRWAGWLVQAVPGWYSSAGVHNGKHPTVHDAVRSTWACCVGGQALICMHLLVRPGICLAKQFSAQLLLRVSQQGQHHFARAHVVWQCGQAVAGAKATCMHTDAVVTNRAAAAVFVPAGTRRPGCRKLRLSWKRSSRPSGSERRQLRQQQKQQQMQLRQSKQPRKQQQWRQQQLWQQCSRQQTLALRWRRRRQQSELQRQQQRVEERASGSALQDLLVVLMLLQQQQQ